MIKAVRAEIAFNRGQVNVLDVPPPIFFEFDTEDCYKQFVKKDKTLRTNGARFAKSNYMRRYGYQNSGFEVY